MYIITVAGKEKEGAYSVVDDDGEQVLYIFMEEDDAERYSMQLEELDYPEMNVLEIEDELTAVVSNALEVWKNLDFVSLGD